MIDAAVAALQVCGVSGAVVSVSVSAVSVSAVRCCCRPLAIPASSSISKPVPYRTLHRAAHISVASRNCHLS